MRIVYYLVMMIFTQPDGSLNETIITASLIIAGAVLLNGYCREGSK